MRFPEQRGGGVFLSRFEIARPFFACASGDGNQRLQFVTFYEISTLAVVEFISSPATIGKKGEDRGMDAGYFRALSSFFFSLLIIASSERERGSRLP